MKIIIIIIHTCDFLNIYSLRASERDMFFKEFLRDFIINHEISNEKYLADKMQTNFGFYTEFLMYIEYRENYYVIKEYI